MEKIDKEPEDFNLPSKKCDEMRVGLLLTPVGERCLEIYAKFALLPARA